MNNPEKVTIEREKAVVDDIAVYCRAAIADWRDVLYWWETPELAAEGARHMQERLEDDDE